MAKSKGANKPKMNRRFDKKVFRLAVTFYRNNSNGRPKAAAKKAAEKWRKRGGKARVVKGPSDYMSGNVWCVYVRS